eukprot:RCo006520
MSFLPSLLLLSLFSHALFSAFFCGGLRPSCAVGQSVCPPEAVIFVQKPQSLGNAGLDVEKVSLFSLGTLPLTLHPPSQPPIDHTHCFIFVNRLSPPPPPLRFIFATPIHCVTHPPTSGSRSPLLFEDLLLCPKL